MKLVNKTGLHEAIERAIRWQDARWYTGAGEERFASVTDLLKPPGMVVLEKTHNGEIVEDASDRLWTLMGSAMHRVIELSDDPNDPNTLSEQRFAAEIAGKKITGGVDYIAVTPRGLKITDFKFTSVWSYIYGDRIDDWEAQLNLYALLARLNGAEVDSLEVCLIFRDWSAREAEKGGRYPATQVVTIPVTLWSAARVKSYAEMRVRNLMRAFELEPEDVPECSKDDRWEKAAKFAVMKEGRKSSMKNCESDEEARQYIEKLKPSDQKKCSVVPRPGERVRCKRYCRVATWCPGYQATLAGNKGMKGAA